MKKSLLKSLALASLVLSFAACDGGGSSTTSSTLPPPEPEVMSIGAAIEWDGEVGATVNDGKLVTITEAVVNNKFGNSIIVQQTEGDSLSGIKAVEVITEGPAAFGWKDIVNVTGTVGDIDGRPVILDAEVTYSVSEAESKGKGSVYGYGGLSRAGFDEIANRGTSGMLMWGGLVQFATLPGTVVAGQVSEFKVVFPGEKLEANNPIAVPVTIPALTAEEAEIVNAFFADKNEGAEGTVPDPIVVGDAFGIVAPTYWSVDNVGFVFGPYGALLHDGFGVVDNVFDDWDELGVEDYFLSPMPDLSKDGTNIYSYVLEEGYFDTEDGWGAGLLVTAYTDEADDDFDILVDRVLDDDQLFWFVAEEESDYVALVGYVNEDDADEDYVSLIELENAGSYINIWLSGEVLEWADVIAHFEAAAAAYLGEESFTTTLPEYNDPLVQGFEVDDDWFEDYGEYDVYVYTDPSSTYNYGVDLVAAGFTSLGADEDGDLHFLNEETNEYVILVLGYLADYGVVILAIFVD